MGKDVQSTCLATRPAAYSRNVGPGFSPAPTFQLRFLLADVQDAVAARDRRTGPAADAISRRVIVPSGVAAAGATPWAIEVVGGLYPEVGRHEALMPTTPAAQEGFTRRM